MKRIFLIASLYALTAMTAQAEVNVDSLVASYQAEGYTSIEVTRGLTQTKVEAIKGDVKIEVIYDSATGQILKNETDSAAGEFMRPGVKLRERNRDFVRVVRADDEDDDGSDRDDDETDDDSNDDSGSDDDNEGDDSSDDSNDDSSDDDNEGDDSGDDSNDDSNDDSEDDDSGDDSDEDNSGSDDESDDDSED